MRNKLFAESFKVREDNKVSLEGSILIQPSIYSEALEILSRNDSNPDLEPRLNNEDLRKKGGNLDKISNSSQPN